MTSRPSLRARLRFAGAELVSSALIAWRHLQLARAEIEAMRRISSAIQADDGSAVAAALDHLFVPPPGEDAPKPDRFAN